MSAAVLAFVAYLLRGLRPRRCGVPVREQHDVDQLRLLGLRAEVRGRAGRALAAAGAADGVPGLVSILISWRIELRPKEYFAWLLVLETSLLGVFSALDFMLFFLFWEIELVPMYLLISIWGSGNRVYSALEVRAVHVLRLGAHAGRLPVLGFSAETFDIRELARDRRRYGTRSSRRGRSSRSSSRRS